MKVKSSNRKVISTKLLEKIHILLRIIIRSEESVKLKKTGSTKSLQNLNIEVKLICKNNSQSYYKYPNPLRRSEDKETVLQF